MLVDVLFPIHADAFTYFVPEDLKYKVGPGVRVLAPFKRGKKVGIVQSKEPRAQNQDLNKMKLKSIESVLDDEPLVPEKILKLIKWVGEYYMSTSGLALKNAVPSAFFTGKKAGRSRIVYDEEVIKAKVVDLNDEQTRALGEINSADKGVFLAHGVTGSGKTEIYIRAIKALPPEREAVVLVPEIAITTQMIDRFRAHFGESVVFFHSGLSVGERITQWRRMRNGEVRVVIGVRSAVFAPFNNLGLIVIDEEQEASYKQFEGLRYNARDTALARAQLEGVKVILGSATPSMEAYFNARSGRIRYLELTQRIEQRPLPGVDIIDMTKEEKQTFSLSNKLLEALKENMGNNHQSLIMLNRRGYSPFFMCTDCGHTYKCPACSITLIYHKDTNTLNCHYCGSYLNPQAMCPTCKGTRIKHLGTGTQRAEEEIQSLMPGLAFKRMDRDTTQKKLSHYRIIRQMEEKKIDVLLGTQMVAKGHDFPDVTLSAVISADIALNMPDFRSAERAFQLFTQLAGRAGRGEVPGRAYIQTYEPEHYVFDFVRSHDYKGFYDKEIELRKELSYPPFSRLLRIIFSFKNKGDAGKTVKVISGRIRRMNQASSPLARGGVEILGPAPAPVEKIRNLWRWHIIMKGKNAKALRQAAAVILEKLKDVKNMKIDIDVDPINML
ncbi:MAG: primosomal protein N' [Nitrospiraceae bacterium]|nr:MAG: primosomal protein N' [Nitrospiraceae bacterium]